MVKIEKAQKRHLEEIVAMSKRAFETDIEVGGTAGDYPPEYDSINWHKQMLNEGHLFQVLVDDELIGGAILFLSEDKESLYIGRIFVDSLHHRKGYGISLMGLVEKIYSNVKKINLDTPIWNIRTNSFYKKLGYVEWKQEDGFSFYQKELK
ncbi:MAG: GNAT family N-acetyltransferase [Spirochaetaceae bacterium]|nr:GNAT family N-acetyltransferase [Spirochaetaceae bacterium]